VTTTDFFKALQLPEASLVDRRVPKSLLIENGAPTAADKRKIKEGVERLQWVAALKPTTIGVAEYRDSEREYLEIAVLSLEIRTESKFSRLVELVHRAVPYPVVVVASFDDRARISLAHKRWSQSEAEKSVLGGDVVAVAWRDADEPHRSTFLKALAISEQPSSNLLSLYQGWIDVLHALMAARLTGVFEIPKVADRLSARRSALADHRRLETEIAQLQAAATKEPQMPRRVDFNLELKRREAERAAALAKL